MSVPDAHRWNHSIHYHPTLLALGPAANVLDVGCGEGMLTRQFAVMADTVIGIDRHQPSIALARSLTSESNIE